MKHVNLFENFSQKKFKFFPGAEKQPTGMEAEKFVRDLSVMSFLPEEVETLISLLKGQEIRSNNRSYDNLEYIINENGAVFLISPAGSYEIEYLFTPSMAENLKTGKTYSSRNMGEFFEDLNVSPSDFKSQLTKSLDKKIEKVKATQNKIRTSLDRM